MKFLRGGNFSWYSSIQCSNCVTHSLLKDVLSAHIVTALMSLSNCEELNAEKETHRKLTEHKKIIMCFVMYQQQDYMISEVHNYIHSG